MATIHFDRVNPYGITLESGDQLNSSTFRDAYSNAFTCLIEIINANKEDGRSDQKKGLNNDNHFFFDVKEFNNILALTGERGSGKTTAMLSFVNSLTNNCIIAAQYPDIKKCTFISLPVIDPSKLADGESLLGLVVARIYEEIEAIVKRSKTVDYNSRTLRDAVEACENTYKAIRNKHQSFIENIQQNPDDLEHLSELANTSQLRKNIHKLVLSYIRLWYFERWHIELREDSSEIERCYLIFPIDDLDTNIEKGYQIAEDIRCFFMMPNVIVPIALKLEQLSDLVEQKFMLDFGKMIDKKDILDAHPAELAAKYIQKLIPMQRRIKLPTFEIHTLDDVKVVTQKTAGQVNLVDYFLQLVWKTTGIIMTKNRYNAHPLLPLNLRALHQLIDLLENMDYIVIKGDNNNRTAKHHQNLNKLEEWVLDCVSSNAVPREMANILRRFVSHPNEGLNGFLVKQLVQYSIDNELQGIDARGQKTFTGLFGTDKTVLDIINTSVHPGNISIGDVMYLLEKMTERDSSEGIRHFVAAVKMLYSIRVTRLRYPAGDDTLGPVNENGKEIRRLLGGLVCNPNIELSQTGMEWTVNGYYTGAYVSLNGKSINLYRGLANKTEQKENTKRQYKEMSLKQCLWISFFIVVYGQIRNSSLQAFAEGCYLDSIAAYNRRRDDLPFYVSAHWLGFILSTLTIDETIHRFLGANEKHFETEQEYMQFKGEIKDWQSKYFAPLPINSIEVISDLVVAMHRNRWKYGDEKEIGKMNELFFIMKALDSELNELLSNTCIDDVETIMDALHSCPIFRADEAESYLASDIDDRCFDWLIRP